MLSICAIAAGVLMIVLAVTDVIGEILQFNAEVALLASGKRTESANFNLTKSTIMMYIGIMLIFGSTLV